MLWQTLANLARSDKDEVVCLFGNQTLSEIVVFCIILYHLSIPYTLAYLLINRLSHS